MSPCVTDPLWLQHHSSCPESWTRWLHSQITRGPGCGDGGYVGFTISLLLPPGGHNLVLSKHQHLILIQQELSDVDIFPMLWITHHFKSIQKWWVLSNWAGPPCFGPAPCLPRVVPYITACITHSFLAHSVPRSALLGPCLLSCYHCQQCQHHPSCYHRIQTSIESQPDRMTRWWASHKRFIQDIRPLKMHWMVNSWHRLVPGINLKLIPFSPSCPISILISDLGICNGSVGRREKWAGGVTPSKCSSGGKLGNSSWTGDYWGLERHLVGRWFEHGESSGDL